MTTRSSHVPPFHPLPMSHGNHWYPAERDTFFAPVRNHLSHEPIDVIRARMHAAPDGMRFAVRGRDYIRSPARGMTFSAWEYGTALKQGRRLYFMWTSGDTEDFLIDGVDFLDLVHFRVAIHGIRDLASATFASSRAAHQAAELHGERKHDVSQGEKLGTASMHTDRVVIIAHGYSPVVGPNYALIRTLEKVSRDLGWTAVVPDFRASYEYGPQRGRSERVRMFLEELIWAQHQYKPSRVVVVGHSQGGAVVAQVASKRVVQAANVKGVLMFGAENAMEMDGQRAAPAAPIVRVVHPEGDRVIHPDALRGVARQWGVPFVEIPSKVAHGVRDVYGDDVLHDFLPQDLMDAAVAHFADVLKRCESV